MPHSTILQLYHGSLHIKEISLLLMLVSDNWKTQYILEQWVFFEINLNDRRSLKLNYDGKQISVYQFKYIYFPAKGK
jgi:hypothetical protein